MVPAWSPNPGTSRVDAAGGILVPPLINGHTHAAMTLFRGYGDDLPLMRWLEEKIWPVERKLEPEDVYWGTRLACLEMIRTGTARFWDMYWHPTAAARAVPTPGCAPRSAAPLIDVDGRSEEMRAAALRSLDELADVERTGRRFARRTAIYTVTENSLRWIAELAAERELPVQIHLSETEQEVIDCLAAHGERPAHYLDRVGLLTPRTVLAHGVWLDDDELELIAASRRGRRHEPGREPQARRRRGVPLPAGARRRRAGRARHRRSRARTTRSTCSRHEGARARPEARREGRRRDRRRSRRGRSPPAGGPVARRRAGLEVGQPADFLLLRADAPELSFGELPAALVYAASGSVVQTTVVAGQVLMRDGEIEGADEVLAHALERARGLGLSPPRRIGGARRPQLA